MFHEHTFTSQEELKKLAEIYKESIGQNDENIARFSYGKALVESEDSEDVLIGIEHLLNISKMDFEDTKECFYLISFGYYQLKEYQEAGDYATKVLTLDPRNEKTFSLLQEIRKDNKKDLLIKGGIIGGIGIFAGFVLGSLFRKRKNN